MVLYSIILFLAAIPMIKISIAIYQGKTDLIHDYHQTKVTDKAAYGRAFGRAMMVNSAALLLSGIVGLFGFSDRMATIAVATLFVGLFIGIAIMIIEWRKGGKSLFGADKSALQKAERGFLFLYHCNRNRQIS